MFSKVLNISQRSPDYFLSPLISPYLPLSPLISPYLPCPGSYYQSAAGEMRLTVLESTDTVLTDSIATLSRLSPQKITVYAGAAITLQVIVQVHRLKI